jgi:hypothetical protein
MPRQQEETERRKIVLKGICHISKDSSASSEKKTDVCATDV